jgi:hypothetical protein
VESEDAQPTDERVEVIAYDAIGTNLSQGLAEEEQVRHQPVGTSMLTCSYRLVGSGYTEPDEIDVLAPTLVGIAGEGGETGLAERLGMFLDLPEKHRGGVLEMVAQGESLAEGFQTLRPKLKGAPAKK